MKLMIESGMKSSVKVANAHFHCIFKNYVYILLMLSSNTPKLRNFKRDPNRSKAKTLLTSRRFFRYEMLLRENERERGKSSTG
ncbi:CLUMA_CG004714, isoform A [Clunio marinus]|uniref:CLUMA_CG004714, isoform A n=1 Tax=Clunio marinus TaxID=568069 RepID=A0A1J1HTZ0_9DIPT|nr:CLUMA_CG004714, isoform A [Clunio marinus]